MGKYETKLSNKMSAGHFSDCSILKSWIKSRKGYLIAFTNNVLQSLEDLRTTKNNWISCFYKGLEFQVKVLYPLKNRLRKPLQTAAVTRIPISWNI